MHIERALKLINLVDIPEKKRRFWPQRSIIVINSDGMILDVIQHFGSKSLETAAENDKYYPGATMFFGEPGWYKTPEELERKIKWALEDSTDDTYVLGKGLIDKP